MIELCVIVIKKLVSRMFKYFRIVFGLYLIYHFLELVPYAEELFGEKMPYDHKLSPLYGIFPNILDYVNATSFLQTMIFFSILYIIGIRNRPISVFLWYGWACLFNRNILIANPGLPYVGWLLIFSAFIKNDRVTKYYHLLAWFLMALGYTVSGIHKLWSPSWIDGSALYHVLNSPIARDNILRDTMVEFPGFLKIMTWISLFLEISFLPLGMFRNTRFTYWVIYIFFHIGIMLLVNFTDLTLGVLMIHFVTFEPRWIRKTITKTKTERNYM